ncbi:hypothetical protein CLV84_2237 [Neolewinella xylanilytica]|uniref:DUF4044 domain-containing protein n=1 Tax=Neolewinella xylanilytica TaxID=1514080 RepID=A0A2S6I2N2_9BACT|nr:hypothetical protein [Neolewinella xylanilytica]PPK85341.1 hypothetical protein CLV84_2237 [Neolewinella xylanilytica]
MKDCCQPDEKPGPIKRVTRSLTIIVLTLLALAALVSVLIRMF